MNIREDFGVLRQLQIRVDALEQHKGSGPPSGGNGMEARIAKVEAAVDHIQSDLSDIKSDTREIKRDAREDFRILAGLIIAAVVAIVGVMAKGFHWL
jgi:hypothetical protein